MLLFVKSDLITYFVGQDFVESVAVIPERDSAVGSHIVDVNVLVKIHNKLALGMDLHQDLLLVHGLDHLAHVAALLLQVLQLFPQHSHLGIQLISLSLQVNIIRYDQIDSR